MYTQLKYKQHYTHKHDLILLAKIWHASTPPKQSPPIHRQASKQIDARWPTPIHKLYTGTDTQTQTWIKTHAHTQQTLTQ